MYLLIAKPPHSAPAIGCYDFSNLKPSMFFFFNPKVDKNVYTFSALYILVICLDYGVFPLTIFDFLVSRKRNLMVRCLYRQRCAFTTVEVVGFPIHLNLFQ